MLTIRRLLYTCTPEPLKFWLNGVQVRSEVKLFLNGKVAYVVRYLKAYINKQMRQTKDENS